MGHLTKCCLDVLSGQKVVCQVDGDRAVRPDNTEPGDLTG